MKVTKLKKNKFIKPLGIVTITLLLLWGLVRITGMLQFYSIPTGGNSPAINVGDKILASNLLTHHRLDFVCYNQVNPKFPDGVWLRRICGMPGDVVLIEDGILFVNGKNVDQSLNIMRDYFVHKRDVKKFENENSWPWCEPDSDSCRISIEENLLDNSVSIKPFIHAEKGKVHSEFNQDWTLDNFGPITVPEESYFLLGDNRHNSLDSRTTGFVMEEDIVGVVLW